MGSLINWIMSPEGSEKHRKYFEQLEKDNSMTNKKCLCDNTTSCETCHPVKKCTCNNGIPNLKRNQCLDCGLKLIVTPLDKP